MHPPDKPAFLSGSDRATPFLSLPFCPGQMNDEMSERHLSASDKIATPLLSPSPSSLGKIGLLREHITQWISQPSKYHSAEE